MGIHGRWQAKEGLWLWCELREDVGDEGLSQESVDGRQDVGGAVEAILDTSAGMTCHKVT